MAEEKNFEIRIKKFLESKGVYPLGQPRNKMEVEPIGYYEKRWGGGTFTKAGLPDIHAVIHGRSWDIEVKASKGRPSELQLFIIAQINECGGKAMLLYPKDFEEFKRLIEKEVLNEN